MHKFGVDPVEACSHFVVVSESSQTCLEKALHPYSVDLDLFDSAVFYSTFSKKDGAGYLPMNGNGAWGIWMPNELHLHHGRTLSLAVPLRPIAVLQMSGGVRSADAVVTEYRRGLLTNVQAWSIGGHCVIVKSTIYWHRRYPGLLVEDILVDNPLDRSVDFAVERTQPSWLDSSPLTVKQKGGQPSQITAAASQYQVVSGKVQLPGDHAHRYYVVSAALPRLPASLTVKARSRESQHFVNAFEYSEPAAQEVYANHRSRQTQSLDSMLQQIGEITSANLLESHAQVWQQHWQSGFELSWSRAPDVLNGDLINQTIYQLLCHTSAPIHQHALADSTAREQALRALSAGERCYSAHNTLLYPSKLWARLRSLAEQLEVVERWKVTLEKLGCAQILESGADGLLQAVLLSLGGLKRTHAHLEFDIHPRELHRDLTFRHLLLGNATSAATSFDVRVHEDNKAWLYVRQDAPGGNQSRQTLFACDAACLDEPVQLAASSARLPVKLTNPLTPVLYVAGDRAHLLELKHTIHVSEVVEAPAHEHHLLALHRHGHSLGGLPLVFWISLALLIGVFHCFLCKLIYNEYCRDDKQIPYYPNRNRYRV